MVDPRLFQGPKVSSIIINYPYVPIILFWSMHGISWYCNRLFQKQGQLYHVHGILYPLMSIPHGCRNGFNINHKNQDEALHWQCIMHIVSF